MRRLQKQNWVIPRIKTIALITFAGYIVWNAAWLFHGQIPPSIFSYCTGLPCPTTGMTRSIICLCRGNALNFFLFNPFTLVYLALTGGSFLLMLNRCIQRKDIAIPGFIAWAWMVALEMGWFTKIAIGNRYW